ncbi:MAG: CBS domain-containing protein [Thiobacillus sp.]|nr:CBS domain-containing protein [Thiobacillus sp.]
MAGDREHALSLAFMRGHPAQAARVLESLPADEAAVLFAQVPARLGAEVLAAMLPYRAAHCIESLGDARALELLAQMGTQPTVAVLRHLPEPRRQRLITGLPTAAAVASTLLLGFAEDTLGAWANPDVVVLPADTRATHALERMRQAPASQSQLFVADRERRLAGIVHLGTLLQAPEGATLGTLMQRAAHVLAAHSPLSAAPAHPGWEGSSVLPVVEPGERLVGVMTRDALTRALRRVALSPARSDGEPTLPVLLARGYWQALSGLLEAGLALLPRVPSLADTNAEKPDER